MKEVNVAVLPGDGIGKEIMAACLKILDKVQSKVGGYSLNYKTIDAGAEFYVRTGIDITDSDFRACGEADAILDGETGHLCDGNDLSALYETLLKMLKNNNYKQLGLNALEFSNNFKWDKIIKKYIKLI